MVRETVSFSDDNSVRDKGVDSYESENQQTYHEHYCHGRKGLGEKLIQNLFFAILKLNLTFKDLNIMPNICERGQKRKRIKELIVFVRFCEVNFSSLNREFTISDKR